MATKLATQSLLLFFFLGFATACPYQRTVSYADQVLVRCERNGNGVEEFLGSDEADVWQISRVHADVRVSRDVFYSTPNLDCVVVANVEDLVRKAENLTFPAKPEADWFEEYHQYGDIVQRYEDLARDNPDLVTFVQSIGKSVEGRDMPAIHITATQASEYRVFFQCQIHAREWISGAVCMYLADRLVKEHSSNEQVASLLKTYEFVIVPFANPDGYAYTWSNDRLWRKNRRQPPSGSPCYGVDLNRNFPFHWNEGGSSSRPCSETYMGTEPNSEIETQNVMAYFRSQKPIIAAIDWHSYSQLILRPPGWSSNPNVIPESAEFKALGDMMQDEIKKVHGKTYVSQTGADLYVATGGAEDWFYSEGEQRVGGLTVWAFTYELRPDSSSGIGFLLPPEQIIPNGEEVYPAVLKLVEEAPLPQTGF